MPNPLLSLINAGVGLVSDVVSYGEQQAASAAKQAELLRSARLEEANSVDALSTGALLGGRIRTKGSQLVAQQRVVNAVSGIEGSTGTAAAVSGSTAAMAELDAQQTENNAARAAWGHRAVARNYRAGAAEVQRQSDNASLALGLKLATRAVGLGGDLFAPSAH